MAGPLPSDSFGPPIPTPWSIVEDEVAAELDASEVWREVSREFEEHHPAPLRIHMRLPDPEWLRRAATAMVDDRPSLATVANDEGVLVTIDRAPTDSSIELRVKLAPSLTTSHISENALEDTADPMALLQDAVRTAAQKHRAFVLDGILDRMSPAKVMALLVARVTQPDLAERAALELIKSVESLR